MNILYVSDLDGTLLNEEEKIDLYNVQEINKLIDKGINFTISTGRGESVTKILNDINFKIPVMLLNGSINYDFAQKKYIDAITISSEKILEIRNKLEKININKFETRTLVDNKLSRFEISKWDEKSNCLCIDLLDTKEKMYLISEELKKIKEIDFFIHKNVYINDLWWCNITLKKVSKASSLKALKDKYNFDKIIAFGDSENDLPLLEVSDEFYAVSNATNIVKQKATGIIDSNINHGVVNFIKKTLQIN